MSVKIQLKYLDPTNLSFPEGTKIFVNVHTKGDYGTNVRNFGIIRTFIHTLLSIVSSESNKMKMVHIKTLFILTV